LSILLNGNDVFVILLLYC